MIRDDFSQMDPIILGLDDRKNAMSFIFSPAATPTAKGSISYGTLISSATVSASDSNGDNVSSEIIDSISVSTTSIIVKLDYPTVTGVGTYSLKFVLTLDDGSIWSKNYNRLIAEE